MQKTVVQIVEDTRYQNHRGPEGHPERPERLVAIGEAIDLFRDDIESVTPRAAEPEEILRVHRDALVDFLASTSGQSPGRIDADTYYAPSSFEVARLAAGGSIDLARSVMRGDAARGLAAVRPPGHHAEADRAMGFCLFNNVALATRAIQAEFDSPRVLILDWDVHHGNGTQHSFEEDPNVLYISTHQFPFYPGTGDFGEAGVGLALGATINIPMPAGCGDSEYVGIMQRLIVPAAIHFRPDVILVSCGFDAHREDPLASMELTIEGYRAMAQTMRALADDLCGGRIVFVLEGGYSLTGVREGARAVLESLVGPDALPSPDPSPSPAASPASSPPGPKAPIDLAPGSLLREIVDRVVVVHGARIPDLGAA
jgi:acetoin utilization deacetylase AcuC-like enzyme